MSAERFARVSKRAAHSVADDIEAEAVQAQKEHATEAAAALWDMAYKVRKRADAGGYPPRSAIMTSGDMPGHKETDHE